jgi:phosphoribosylformylglycinamidine (FGAM) synthase-like enzyme
VSGGGLAAALAEMAFAGGLGVDVDLVHAPYGDGDDAPPDRVADTDAALLFSESPSRFVCEVPVDRAAAFAAALGGVPHATIGRVTGTRRVVLRGMRGATLVDEDIESLREAFVRPLANGAVR